MEEFYSLTINLHIVTIYIAMALALCYILTTKIKEPKKSLMMYWRLLPLYYFNFSAMLLLGLFLINFITNWLYIGSMSVAWVFMIVTSAKSYKLVKLSFKDETNIPKLRNFVAKKYLVDLVIFALFLASRFM